MAVCIILDKRGCETVEKVNWWDLNCATQLCCHYASIHVVNSNSLSSCQFFLYNKFFHVEANILSAWMICLQQSERSHPKNMQVGICKLILAD